MQPSTPERLLVLDPSSTCTGYAIFVRGQLREFGRLTPRRTKDPANVRIRTMAGEAFTLLHTSGADVVVIEDTSGKVGRRHGGGGAGLAVHGKAVGFIAATLEPLLEGDVHLVPENQWTRGKKKERRQRRVALAHRDYDPKQDPGGDAADAIGLGDWWLTCRRVEAARAMVGMKRT